MTRLLATTALGLLLGLGTATAQQAPMDDTASPPAAMPAEPSDVAPAPADVPAMQTEPSEPAEIAPDQSTQAPQSISPDVSGQEPSKTAQFLNEQQPNDWLASDLIGKSVVNAENESVGRIADLVTDSDGKIVAALIGVGGFLGLGEKDVAIPFNELKLTRDEDNDVTAMLNTSKDALASAPDFKTLYEQEVVEGSIKSDREGGNY